MADFTSDAPFRPRRKAPRGGWEYRAYFVPVLALSLPLAGARAAWAVVSSDPAPRPGVLRDALARAHEVTATICSV